jgi:hypothetical protein
VGHRAPSINYSPVQRIDPPRFTIISKELISVIAARYGLTLKLATFLVFMADGSTMVEAGECVGWSENTTRTMMKRVMELVKLHHQLEIVVLVLKTYVELLNG